MEINLAFPLYAIWRDGGYYSLEDVDDQDKSKFGVMIFTSRERAESYLRDQGIDAVTVCFANSLRFRRFVESLKDPKPEIVCNAIQDENGHIKAEWRAEVQLLIENVLPPIGFIWDYPLHFIFDPRGLASIQGTTQYGNTVTLVAMFTDVDLAERYIQTADVTGEVGAIEDDPGFLEFVNDMADTTDGIIVDPTNAAPGSFGSLCYSKEKLIELLTPDEMG